MTINLDEARAARREANGVQPEIEFGGKTFKLPVELPITTVQEMDKLGEASKAKDGHAITESLLAAMRSLLGDEQYAEFEKLGPSHRDFLAVVEGLPTEYGIALPESSSSETPSKSTSARPRQRSSKSTA